jgi:hypothetical protein
MFSSHYKQLVARAKVIFHDHGYIVRIAEGADRVVEVWPTFRAMTSTPKKSYPHLTAAFDAMCPIIHDNDFTSRMGKLFSSFE